MIKSRNSVLNWNILRNFAFCDCLMFFLSTLCTFEIILSVKHIKRFGEIISKKVTDLDASVLKQKV